MRTVRLKDSPGTRLVVHDAPELVSDTLVDRGEWEPFETRILMTLLGSGATFVDVGANVGYFTCLAANVVGPTGRVFAFEPEPANLALLEQNVAALGSGHVRVMPVALDEAAGEMALWLCPDNRGDHSVIRDETRPAISVECVRGDDVVMGRVDVIKIDVQGAEARVLRGFAETLRRERDHVSLLVEFSPWALEALGDTSRTLLEPLEAQGLSCWIIDHQGERLVPAAFADLHALAASIMAPATRGFMNILLAQQDDRRLLQFTGN